LFANCSEPITGSELESRRPQNSVFNKNPDIPGLSRVKNHINQELQRLGTITCLETCDASTKRLTTRCDLWIQFAWRFLQTVTRNFSHLPVTGSSRRATR
jgi:hypothetical protein